jgi:hypothetical protein
MIERRGRERERERGREREREGERNGVGEVSIGDYVDEGREKGWERGL